MIKMLKELKVLMKNQKTQQDNKLMINLRKMKKKSKNRNKKTLKNGPKFSINWIRIKMER